MERFRRSMESHRNRARQISTVNHYVRGDALGRQSTVRPVSGNTESQSLPHVSPEERLCLLIRVKPKVPVREADYLIK